MFMYDKLCNVPGSNDFVVHFNSEPHKFIVFCYENLNLNQGR